MVGYLKNINLLADGTAFKYLRVVPETMVLTEGGYLRIHNWKGLLKQLLDFPAVRLRDENFVLVHKSYKGYYHWVLESLPRLLQLTENPATITLLLPYWAADEFYQESARILGVKKIKFLSQNTIYRLDRLIMPYSNEEMGSFTKSTLLGLKQALQAAIGYHDAGVVGTTGRKLYVSRRKAVRRKIVNEVEVEQCVARFGFEIVCLEDYTYTEQLHLCSAAIAFLGIHGAGLTNIFLMPEGSTVIELRKFDNGANWFYERLALACEHHYHLQYCQANDELLSVQDADLFVDISKLERLLLAAPGAANQSVSEHA